MVLQNVTANLCVELFTIVYEKFNYLVYPINSIA